MQRQSYDAMPTLWNELTYYLNCVLDRFHCESFVLRSDELMKDIYPVRDRCLMSQIWLEHGLCRHYFDYGTKLTNL